MNTNPFPLPRDGVAEAEPDLSGLSLDEVIDLANERYRAETQFALDDYNETLRFAHRLHGWGSQAWSATQRLAKRNMDVACQPALRRRMAMIDGFERQERDLEAVRACMAMGEGL